MSAWQEASKARLRAARSPQISPQRTPQRTSQRPYNNHPHLGIPNSDTRSSMDTVLSTDTTATVESNLTEADRAPFVLETRYANVLRPPMPTRLPPPIPTASGELEHPPLSSSRPDIERNSSYIESDSEEGVMLRRMGLQVNILSGVSDATREQLSSMAFLDETMDADEMQSDILNDPYVYRDPYYGRNPSPPPVVPRPLPQPPPKTARRQPLPYSERVAVQPAFEFDGQPLRIPSRGSPDTQIERQPSLASAGSSNFGTQPKEAVIALTAYRPQSQRVHSKPALSSTGRVSFDGDRHDRTEERPFISEEYVPRPLRHTQANPSTRDLHNHYNQQPQMNYSPPPIPRRNPGRALQSALLRSATQPSLPRSTDEDYPQVTEPLHRSESMRVHVHVEEDDSTESVRVQELLAESINVGDTREKKPRNYEKDFDWHGFNQRNNAAKGDMLTRARTVADNTENVGQKKVKSPLQPSPQSPVQPSTETFNPRNSVASTWDVQKQTAANHQKTQGGPRRARNLQVVEDIRLQTEPSPEELARRLEDVQANPRSSEVQENNVVFGFDYERASFVSNVAERNRNSNASRDSVVVDPFTEFRAKEHIPGRYSRMNIEGPILPVEEPKTYEGNLDPYGGEKLTTVADNDSRWIAFRRGLNGKNAATDQELMAESIELITPATSNDQILPSDAEGSNQGHQNNSESSNQDHPRDTESRQQDLADIVEDDIKEVSETMEGQPQFWSENVEDDFEETSETVEDQTQNHSEKIEEEVKTAPKIVEDQPQPQNRLRQNSNPVTGLEVIPIEKPKQLGKGGGGLRTLSEITRQVELVTSHARRFKYKLDTRWFGLARKNLDFVIAFQDLISMMRKFMLELTMGTISGWRLFRGFTQKQVGEIYNKYCLALTRMLSPIHNMAQYNSNKTRVQVLRSEMLLLLISLKEIVERIQVGMQHYVPPEMHGKRAFFLHMGMAKDFGYGKQFYCVSRILRSAAQWKDVESRRTIAEILAFWRIGRR